MNKGAPCRCYPEGNDGDCPEHGCIAPPPPSSEAVAKGSVLERIRWHQSQAAFLTQELLGDPMVGVGNLPASPQPTSKEPNGEYICKCGIRVVPHRCQTGKEF